MLLLISSNYCVTIIYGKGDLMIVPFGYKKFRVSKGISERTLHAEVQLIEHFLNYVNTVYKKQIEPHDIKPIDVKNFLKERKNQGIKDSTLRKDLSLIKQFFDYLWTTDKIAFDFTTKIKVDFQIKKSSINIDYVHLKSIYNDVLRNPNIHSKAKVLFMFYLKGWKMRDIREVQMKHLSDNGSSITIEYPKSYCLVQKQTFTGLEVGPILDCVNESLFRNVPYMLSSKIKGDFKQFSIYSAKTYLNSIIEEYNLEFPLHNDMNRIAYVHYMYTKENLHVEQISDVLGIPLAAAAKLVKESLERVKHVDYNEVKPQ